VDVNVQVDVNAREIKSKNDLKSNEHIINILDDDKIAGEGGDADLCGTRINISATAASNVLKDKGPDISTIVHELGHTLGLRHLDEKYTKWPFSNPQYYPFEKQWANRNNAMFSGTKGSSAYWYNEKTNGAINGSQINIAITNYNAHDLNKH